MGEKISKSRIFWRNISKITKFLVQFLIFDAKFSQITIEFMHEGIYVIHKLKYSSCIMSHSPHFQHTSNIPQIIIVMQKTNVHYLLVMFSDKYHSCLILNIAVAIMHTSFVNVLTYTNHIYSNECI